MHYKNGREAKIGDKVMVIPSYGAPVIGILYDALPGNDYCNGRIARIAPNDPTPNLKECLHLDDVLRAIADGAPNAADLAREALKTKELQFSRSVFPVVPMSDEREFEQ